MPKEINKSNFGVQEVKKTRTVKKWSEKAQANVVITESFKEKVYVSLISMAELIWLLSLGEVLYWRFWETGGPIKNMYGCAYEGKQVFITKNMMRKADILHDDGSLEEPNKWEAEKTAVVDDSSVGDDSIPLDINEPITEEQLENAKKGELEGVFAEILSSIQHGESKARAIALKRYLVNEGIMSVVTLSKNTKLEIKEGVEILKEYMTDSSRFDLDELTAEAQVLVDEEIEKAKLKAAKESN